MLGYIPPSVVREGRACEYAMVRELRALERQDFVWAARWAALAEDASAWAFAEAEACNRRARAVLA